MDNLEIYNKYRTVPENALKPFDNGNFKGSDINSMWRIRCLTEQFGVVGHGWTVNVVRLWTEKMKESGETYAFAEIEMKVKIDGEWGEPFTATGGNKLETYVKSKDYYKGSDEAYKMAVTDAFGVACKYLGIGADVYWENDKSKYTKKAEPKQEKADKKEPPKEEEKKEPLTLEKAKELTFTVKGKEWKLGDCDYKQLLYLRDNIKDTLFLDGVNLILTDMAKNSYTVQNENNNQE